MNIYGFQYSLNGHNCSFMVKALTEHEAKQKVTAMSEANFVGRMSRIKRPAKAGRTSKKG